MGDTFNSLTVADARQEIGGGATSIAFIVPPDLTDQYQWQAGQHLTLHLLIGGVEHRRCYTISNPPDLPLRITVKRVPKGVVSNHIADHLKPGAVVDVMPPFGGFSLKPGKLARRTHYFFAAGSGITPLYAMICAMLEKEPHSVAHLVFGNADADSILFREELDALSAAHPGLLTIRHVLSAPSMWTRFSPWRSGRIDAAAIKVAISETPPIAQDVQYWICGPGSMNEDVKAALTDLDVPTDRIHMESFAGTGKIVDGVIGLAATAHVKLGGADTKVPVTEDQTLLEAMRVAGLSPPFSCQSGVCGACQARLVEGKVHMRAHVALEEGEIARGEILTCQSIAMSGRLKIELP